MRLFESYDQLPPFIAKALATHTTSLGMNPVFPNDDFDASIVEDRFDEVMSNLSSLGIGVDNIDDAHTLLSEKMSECAELERPVRKQLERVCKNSVLKVFDIPANTINLDCKLVDEIVPKSDMRILPEGSQPDGVYSFSDVLDMIKPSEVVLQRRVVDALIMGASYFYGTDFRLYEKEIYKINKELPRLYAEIQALKDFLLFVEEEQISDDKPKEDSYVEVTLGKNGNRTSIYVQALIFPGLLHDTFRGLFELFSSHGLPSDRKLAMAIVRAADFIVAEPWDMRLGVSMWDMLADNVEHSDVVPYLFTDICKMEPEEFNEFMRSVFSGDSSVRDRISNMVSSIEHDMQYDKFVDKMKMKNSKMTILSDSVEPDEVYFY